MAKLSVRTGSQAGMDFPVDRPIVRIGRGSGNEIALQDTQASRNHAEIGQQGDQFYIRDLGSTNGTFVNGERTTGTRLLRPGDQIRIGETTMGYQPGPGGAAPVVADDWESDLWQDTSQRASGAGGRRWLVWGLVGLVVVLLIGAAVAAALLLGGKEATPTPMAIVPTETGAATQAVVIPPSATSETVAQGQPTETPLVDLPTSELLPTVEMQATVPTVKPPQVPTGLPSQVPTGLPSQGQMPASVPSSPADLEKLPAQVQEFLGNIPPEQLPQAIAAQMQSMKPEELQQMIAALFPGATPQQLPEIVAASFPGLSQQELQGMFNMAFPGQNIQVPEPGSLAGKIVLGIYDQGRNQYDVYLANILGQPKLVTENASDPSLSPDGQYIVYHSSAPDKGGLRIMKTDGSQDTQLTSIASDRNPRFSPDGTRILYSNIDNNTLHVINRDGSGRRDLGQGKYPDWSPNGQEIVYQGCVTGGRCGLIRANADGSNARQITTNANDTMPRWRYGNIAFLSDRDGNFEIYVISDNGTWLRRITLDPATDIMPVWNPGGVQIAFRSDRKGDPAIYITSGIGGGDFKQFSAAFGSDWMLAGMDWGK